MTIHPSSAYTVYKVEHRARALAGEASPLLGDREGSDAARLGFSSLKHLQLGGGTETDSLSVVAERWRVPARPDVAVGIGQAGLPSQLMQR